MLLLVVNYWGCYWCWLMGVRGATCVGSDGCWWLGCRDVVVVVFVLGYYVVLFVLFHYYSG